MKRYSEEHQWVELEAGVATVGITAYAAEELGEITFIELPENGTVLAQGDALCVVESVKAASDVFAPVGGTIREVNANLEKDPGLMNDSPERDAWICRLEEVDEAEVNALMTEAEYEEFVASDDDDE